jgi:hypothetical protein
MSASERLRALDEYARVNAAGDDLLRNALPELIAVVESAEQRPCNRFDVTPCSERPELTEATWCAMCLALAALDAKLGGQE